MLAHGISTAFQFATLFALAALLVSVVVVRARPPGAPEVASASQAQTAAT